MTLDPCLTAYIKLYSEWTKILNSRPETIKLLGENIGNLRVIGFGNDFLVIYDARNIGNQSKVRQVCNIKLKSFCRA